MDFRIRQLQCFLTLSDLLNFGQTARALDLSQSTVTCQISSLEESLGAKLFERDRQKVRITNAGFNFRKYARSIVDTVEKARECIGDGYSQRKLRVSCGPFGPFLILPPVVRALAAKHPDFELDLIELTTEQQMAGLADGSVDAVLMVGVLPLPGARFDPICTEPLVAVVSRESPLAALPKISVQHLRHTPLIASQLKDCRFQQASLHVLFAPYGITPRILEAPHSSFGQFAYVLAGKGVAIVPASMNTCAFPGAVFLPFDEPLPPLQLGMVSLDTNEGEAMNLFRDVVAGCASATFGDSLSPSTAESDLPSYPARELQWGYSKLPASPVLRMIS